MQQVFINLNHTDPSFLIPMLLYESILGLVHDEQIELMLVVQHRVLESGMNILIWQKK